MSGDKAKTKTYLVRMKPLEPYSFGTEDGYKFAGAESYGKETYFIRSRELPEQTTILGMLRYLILEKTGILRSDFNYNNIAIDQMKKYIGESSFSFSSREEQDFGIIKSISPVFLVDDMKGSYYVKNPFNNKSKRGFCPMELESQKITTSFGEIRFPKEGEFDYKEWHAGGYYNVTEKKTAEAVFSRNSQSQSNAGQGVNDGKKGALFTSAIFTGNRKNGSDTDEDGFFKRETKILHKDFSFAIFLTVNETLLDEAFEGTKDGKSSSLFNESGIVGYMGQKRSAFKIRAEVSENDLEEKVRKAFETSSAGTSETGTWYYALSDIVIAAHSGSETPMYEHFCVVEKKMMRNLETILSGKSYVRKRRKSDIQYNLIESGSVFYGSCPFMKNRNKNHENIGYSQILAFQKNRSKGE